MYGPAILVSRMSKNVQDIRQSHQVHHRSNKKTGKWNRQLEEKH